MRKMGSFVESEGDEYDLLLEEASASKKVVVVGDTAEC